MSKIIYIPKQQVGGYWFSERYPDVRQKKKLDKETNKNRERFAK